jgi:predicted nucleic acid-binding protein
MRAKQFFDTNILIYAFASNDPRSAQAESLIAEGGAIGVQVLNEFTNVARRKLRWQWGQIEASLTVVEELFGPVAPLTKAIHSRAVALARNHGLSVYDALIVAAALDSGCQLLYSEDMQHGRRFETLTVENPFRREAD